MRKFFSIAIFITLFLSVLHPSISAKEITEKVIVIYEDKIDETTITKLNGHVTETYEHVSVVIADIPLSAIELLEKDDAVLSVEVDQVVRVNQVTKNWGLDEIKAPAAWESGYTGKGVNVAVLDTGIAQHKDLSIAGGVSFILHEPSFLDENGHGTHVAGIIGSKNHSIGVAPDVNLYAVKVLDKTGEGLVSSIIAGIDWAMSHNIDIINISLGAPQDSKSLKNIIDKAYDNGILIVAAAGNSGGGSSDTVQYPARHEAVIAVSAIDSSRNRPSFSATGPSIEVTAPGTNIFSTYLGNGYISMSGTSMAAPHVTGILALLKEAYPTLTHQQLREKLQQTAIDMGDEGRDPLFGFGLVQAPLFVELKEGDRRPEVIQLKLDLAEAGFPVPGNTTNYFGPITATIVRDFQVAFDLEVTGIADKNTLTILQKVLDGEIERPVVELILQEGDRRPEVIQLKLDLAEAGFPVPGNTTNYFGPVTTSVVSEFQGAFDLEVTGIADKKTLTTLQKVLDGEIERPVVELILQDGDRRPEVIQLKLDLAKVGFPVPGNTTNYFGPITASVVSEFQAAFLLGVTGVANAETLTSLDKAIRGDILFLQEGDRRSEVIQLKIDLEHAGFFVSSSPTNFYGPITTSTVKEFQAAYGLPVDGIAGPRTLGKINEISSILKEGNRRPEVIQLKLDLEKLGFFISTNPTNFYGPITTSTVKEFQAAYNLPVTGIADLETRDKLQELVENQS